MFVVTEVQRAKSYGTDKMSNLIVIDIHSRLRLLRAGAT